MQPSLDSPSCPLVSVIIPVYNHQQYVKQALDSVLNQTYPHLEVIIIDDGSKDESVKTIENCLKEWQDKFSASSLNRQISFIQQANQGAHTTINRGLAMAKGDFLTILNSDDYYHLDRMQILVDRTLAAKAQLTFSYVAGIDDHNRPLLSKHWWTRWHEKSKGNLFNKPTLGFLLLQANLAVSTGNLFFSKQLFEEVGPFKDLKLAHDWDFVLRALILTEPLLIREDLYFYRIHPSNTQHQVQHLMKQERNEIYRTYLTQIASAPPKNELAPCHWYWPLDFARIRLLLKMDQSLAHYISHFNAEKSSDAPSKSVSVFQSSMAYKKSKPICLVSHDLSLTGAPKLVADLALVLKNQGYQPSVLALKDGQMRAELEKEGIPVYAPSGFILKRMIHFFFLACFKTQPLTIVNSVASWPFIALMALFRPFQNLRWYIHESYIPNLLDGRISFYLFKWFHLKKSRRIWFGSESTKKAWKVYNVEGDVLYWSGISDQSSPEKIKSDKEEAPLKNLLSVGTASGRKGTHSLIEAFLFCLEKQLIPADTTLTIIGFPSSHTPDFTGLEDIILRVVSSKFKNQIHLIGAIPPEKLTHYYEIADLFIQSSIAECLPISLLTAMSKGLPIITTDVDGCSEAIQHEYNGYLCRPFDRQALANAMIHAIHHPDQSQAYGRQAQKTFNERFSLEKTQPAILSLLNT